MSVQKIIKWSIFAVIVIGSILAGGLFQFIDLIMVRPIINLLFVIFNLVGDFGLAIIVFTVIIKILMWPLVKKQLHQARLMRKIQPELAEIRKNCRGNRQLESLQTMDLYKRYNLNPFASIFTLLIQFPIFIALFSAIQVIATPMPNNNLSGRVYPILAYEGSIIQSIEKKQKTYLDDLKNNDIPATEKASYDFHPQLFGVINLEAKASDILSIKHFSWSAVFMLACAVLASFVQYFATRQQMPSGKSEKRKKFRDLVKSAADGKDVEQSEINGFATGQMAKMMPIMMFMIMFNIHGAIAFYYFLNNIFTFAQQHLILKKAESDMDNLADKAILKELKNIKEAEIIENKKTGTKITRISAKDSKKKRR